jgi:DNA-binding response OmpR family regulator
MINSLFTLKNKTILFAEDDTVMREQTAEILSMMFQKVYTAKNGQEAYEIYEDEKPDLIITDIKMPLKDGLKLAEQIRKHDYTTPIILLTSFTDRDLLINAANLSIDGYLTKPVQFEQLSLTICTSMQRINKDLGILRLGDDITYNIGTKELYRNGSPLTLGSKEYELLELLISKRHLVVSKEEIASCLWPLDAVCNSAIKNLILRLRKKLGDDLILSVRSIGYRINTDYCLTEISKTSQKCHARGSCET